MTADTYRNPILHADWSDPDVIRVGNDFYLVASSFHRVPGLPILSSRDLVNWRIIGHALPRLEPEDVFSTPQLGGGVWAPAIRHHAGRFWIFYPDPDRGIFVVSATDPAGPWTRPHRLKAGLGLIDPCPLWDKDGTAYLVHAWAKSRAGFNNRLTCHRMSPDAGWLLDEGRVVIDGDALPGYRTLEGPKLYRRGEWYWIFAPAGGVTNGWQSAFRSRDVFGPYEERIVLAQGDTDINGPHQGAWVTAPDGRDWFMHFQDKGAFGRVVHLQPMRWLDDGWPEIGDPPGQPVLVHRRPLADAMPLVHRKPLADMMPLGPEWTWAANPGPDWWEPLTGGGVRLRCVPHHGDLRSQPNVLGQRLPSDRFRATVTLRLAGSAVGARAGLAIVGETSAWIGLEHTERGIRLVQGGLAFASAEAATGVEFAVEVEPDGRCRFFAGARPVGEPFTATPGKWVGATLGLFATGGAGWAEVTAWHTTT